MDTANTKVPCGVVVKYSKDLAAAVHELVFNGAFAFVVTPLVHPRFQRDNGPICDDREVPLTRSDLILSTESWRSVVVGELSSWIDLDSKTVKTRQSGEIAFKQEMQWASHLCLSAVVLPRPTIDCFNYANVLRRFVSESIPLWVRIPISGQGDENPWLVWNKLRTMCHHNPTIGVFLEITESLPSKKEVARWTAEPVRAIELPTSIFLCNARGYPVLSAAHQALFVDFHVHGAQVVLSGIPRHSDGWNPYYLYLQHLISRIPQDPDEDEFERSYYDYLQSPLQPLGDHLESSMYETFEKCPVKYVKYEEAIALALSERPADKITVVMVVGAGRGPLVRASLQAANKVMRKVRVYAVEKNPSAVITLRNMKSLHGWGDMVQIVHQDMREWDAPELADILVSELLGSWGDNELSPECLDGAERFLNPVGGVSIPYEYTSFVQPISTPKLWAECKSFAELKFLETMYVVKLHNYFAFSEVQSVFTFAHPSWNKLKDSLGKEQFTPEKQVKHNKKIDNSKHCVLEFVVNETGLCHGFAGYFEAKLHKNIIISINPDTFSTGMVSWFPIYIPLRDPMILRRNDRIKVMFWRRNDATKVWYEWALETPHGMSVLHNMNGQSQPINLMADF